MPRHRASIVAALTLSALVAACSTGSAATSTPASATTPAATAAATTAASSSATARVSANTAAQSEIAAALAAARVPNADRWAREVVEYRPYDQSDATLQKLQENLAKYDPDPATLAGILSVLTP